MVGGTNNATGTPPNPSLSFGLKSLLPPQPSRCLIWGELRGIPPLTSGCAPPPNARMKGGDTPAPPWAPPGGDGPVLGRPRRG